MKKIERETLKALRDFVHKIMSEKILPPLYEQGFLFTSRDSSPKTTPSTFTSS